MVIIENAVVPFVSYFLSEKLREEGKDCWIVDKIEVNQDEDYRVYTTYNYTITRESNETQVCTYTIDGETIVVTVPSPQYTLMCDINNSIK